MCIRDRLKILIVEDYVRTARRIKTHLLKIGHEVTGTARTTSDGLRLFHENIPDLVIMDIELEDSKEGGILLAQSFTKINNTPIIFYSDVLDNLDIMNKAAKINSVAILSKSFDTIELQANIEKAKNEIKRNKNKSQPQDFFTIKELGKGNIRRTIFFKDVCWFESYDGHTRIITDNGSIEYTPTLTKFEEDIANPMFQRIHKSFIININKMRGMNEREVKMKVGNNHEFIAFSKDYKKALDKKANVLKTRKKKDE